MDVLGALARIKLKFFFFGLLGPQRCCSKTDTFDLYHMCRLSNGKSNTYVGF